MARILIVDDDAQFRRVMRVALKVYGHQTREAASGSDAVEEMKGFSPDVVLLDWQMPGMNGGDTCRAIRAVSMVPIIVVSAVDRRNEVGAYGLSRSLVKPVDIGTLLSGIDSALDHKE